MIKSKTFLVRGVFILFFGFAGIMPLCAQFSSIGDEPSYRLYFGVSAGYAQNNLYQGGAENFAHWTNWQTGHGFTVSIPVRYWFFNWFALQSELTYIQKNYSFSQKPPGMPETDESVTNHFVNMPVLLLFSLPFDELGLRFFATGGAFIGFWAASRRKGTTNAVSVDAYSYTGMVYFYDELRKFDKRSDNRLEYGLEWGGGVQYDRESFSIYLEWRYQRGLSDLQKNYYTHYFAPKKNDAWSIQCAFIFNLALFGM